MQGYEIYKIYHPNYSSKTEDEMWKFLHKYKLDFAYKSEFFGEQQEWYLEWEESAHERDSSGECLIIWHKKNLTLMF